MKSRSFKQSNPFAVLILCTAVFTMGCGGPKDEPANRSTSPSTTVMVHTGKRIYAEINKDGFLQIGFENKDPVEPPAVENVAKSETVLKLLATKYHPAFQKTESEIVEQLRKELAIVPGELEDQSQEFEFQCSTYPAMIARLILNDWVVETAKAARDIPSNPDGGVLFEKLTDVEEILVERSKGNQFGNPETSTDELRKRRQELLDKLQAWQKDQPSIHFDLVPKDRLTDFVEATEQEMKKYREMRNWLPELPEYVASEEPGAVKFKQ